MYSFVKSLALTLLPETILRPFRGWHYRRVLRSFSDADEPDLKVVRELVERGTTAVDVGANIGIYTKALSDLVGPAGRVISVEPVPQTFEFLSQNIRSLGLKNISCVNTAVSDSDRNVTMQLPEYDTGGTNFYDARVVASGDYMAANSKQYLRVRASTLDALVATAAPVGFIKCDVEGHELACLTGAEGILISQCAAWLVEVSGDPDESGTNASCVFQLFARHSYVPWWFDGQRLIARRPGDRSINYFFLKPEHLVKLRSSAPQLMEEGHFERMYVD